LLSSSSAFEHSLSSCILLSAPSSLWWLYFLRKFTNNLIMDHLKTIKKVFKYLRFTLDNGQYCASYPIVLEGYGDAY
jgi:hypothetical protein